MRIAEARMTPVAFKEPPLRNAIGIHGPYVARTIIALRTDSGVRGLSETYGDPQTVAALEQLAPRLVGASIYDLNRLQALVCSMAAAPVGAAEACVLAPESDPARSQAKIYGALEVAFLDAQARAADVPLAELLGGRVREQVPFSAYLFFKERAHVGNPYEADDWGRIETADELLGAAERFVREHGFGSIKLKGGVLEPAAEIDCLAALKRKYPERPLRVDPNGNWTLPTARQVCAALGETLEYLEDPCVSLAEMATLHQETGIPMATNMVVTRWDEFAQNVGLRGSQVILADHHYWGGLRATRELAGMCRVFGLGLSMHSNAHLGISLMAMAHVAASVPNLTYACDTHYPWGRADEDVIEGGRIRFEAGAVRITDRPGLGVELDAAALDRLHRQYLACGAVERDDVKQMRLYDPAWVGARPRF